jgi:hypothetical protein
MVADGEKAGLVDSAHSFKLTEEKAKVWNSSMDDPELEGKYKVKLTFFLTTIDPKSGLFEISVRCDFWVRMPIGFDMETNATPKLRVPSCKKMDIQEERIFLDDHFSTERTHLWRGISSWTLQGYELFQVDDFPFDRQLIDLKVLDFRSMPENNLLDIVDFEVVTFSRQASWDPYEADAKAEKVRRRSSEGLPVDGRFNVKLRFERKPEYFITNIFLVACGILVATLFPLGMKASDIGDRLSVYAGGMLTLVAFKYGVSEQLPSVPYNTVTDSWLVSQIGTIIFVMAEALLGYELTAHNVLTVEIMGLIDIILLGVLGFYWVGALIRMGCWRKKQRRSWDVVEKSQEKMHEKRSGP